MSFADLLDESIRLWRQHWITYALISAIGFMPAGLVLVWIGGQGLLQRSFDVADIESGRVTPQALVSQLAGPFALYILLLILFELSWSAAVIAATDTYLHGQEANVGSVYGLAVRRLGIIILSSLAALGASIVLLIACGLLLIPTLGGLLGGPVALICLLVWWLAPGTRKNWFKWFIVLVAPLGLLFYVGGRWSMAVPAIVLETRGPIEGLRRSWQLTENHWFRVIGILIVAALIVSILESVVGFVVQVPLTISAASRGEIGLGPTETAIIYAIQVLFRVLFAGISGAVFAVLFHDLRNRREGADIAERLQELEASPLSTNA
jgi:hypothetical protein